MYMRNHHDLIKYTNFYMCSLCIMPSLGFMAQVPKGAHYMAMCYGTHKEANSLKRDYVDDKVISHIDMKEQKFILQTHVIPPYVAC